MAGLKLDVDATEIMQMAHEEIERLYPERTREWHPLLEMAVYAADPGLPPNLKFQANYKVAEFLIPKKKAVEHTGDAGGLQVVLLNFSEAREQGILPQQQEKLVASGGG